ncbi:MAG TPA: double zinc ribbon domain-containing protein [Magnetospirillaceae bacterium]|nr:double zinc ribbon domain-containing protein [Magnetospirillaceae bacterium]
MTAQLARLGSLTLEILFPRSCVLCGDAMLSEPCRKYPLCARCEESLERPCGQRCPVCGKSLISEIGKCMRCRERQFSFDSAFPLWDYGGSVKDLIIAYKVKGMRRLAGFFAERMGMHLGSRHPGVTVVPVPPRMGKLKQAGWDQVEDIARKLERNAIPVERCLERAPGVSQKTLDYKARLSNLSGKIGLRAGPKPPATVVLLDDVFTTGATLSECARVLKAGGALRVDALTLAAD